MSPTIRMTKMQCSCIPADAASWAAKNESAQIAHVEKLQEFFDKNRAE